MVLEVSVRRLYKFATTRLLNTNSFRMDLPMHRKMPYTEDLNSEK
jgi:hypothetical protein